MQISPSPLNNIECLLFKPRLCYNLNIDLQKIMHNNFAELPAQDDQIITDKFTSGEVDSCQSQKQTFLKKVCSNLERIASILVIIYFLILIVKLMALDDAFISLTKAQTPTNDFNSLDQKKNIELSQLESILNVAKISTKQSPLTKTGLVAGSKNQAQNRLLELSTQAQKPQEKPSILTISENMPETLATGPSSSQDAANFQMLLQEVEAQKQAKQQAGKYSIFEKIYSQMNENMQRTVRPIGQEERQPIIAKYFKNKQNQKNVEELLKENYRYQPTRSEIDTTQLQLLKEKYDISNNEQSTPMCVILATHNNAFRGQIIRTLNSIFNQQHSDFEVIIVDASSSDSTLTAIDQYLNEHEQLKKKTKVIPLDDKSQAFALLTGGKACREDSLVMFLEGNTQLIGKEALNILDSAYRMSNSVVLYPSHYSLDAATRKLSLFNAQGYDESQIFMLAYRQIQPKYGRILACKTATLGNIHPQHIQHNGKYFEFTGIEAMAVSLLELSCGRIKVVDEVMGLSGWDSSVEEVQREDRKHEKQLLAMKRKFDVC